MSMAYYLDTNALYAYYRGDMRGIHHPERQLRGCAAIQALAKTDAIIYVSSLTYVEFVGRLLRHERGKEIKPKRVDDILQRLRQDIGRNGRHRFHLVPIDDAMIAEAQTLMLRYARKNGCSLDTNDAIHIAAAQAITQTLSRPIKMVTSDGGTKKNEKDRASKMKCVCEEEEVDLKVFDPEIDTVE